MELSKINTNLVVSASANEDITFGLVNIWSILIKESGWNIKVFRKREMAKGRNAKEI